MFNYLLVILFLVLFLVEAAFGWGVSPSSRWYILAYFFFIQYTGKLLFKEMDSSRFGQNFLVWMGVRFISAAAFVGFFIWKEPEELKKFLACFFVFYLCFTLFDFILLSRNLRRF